SCHFRDLIIDVRKTPDRNFGDDPRPSLVLLGADRGAVFEGTNRLAVGPPATGYLSIASKMASHLSECVERMDSLGCLSRVVLSLADLRDPFYRWILRRRCFKRIRRSLS